MKKITYLILVLLGILFLSISAEAARLVVKGFYLGMPRQAALTLVEVKYAHIFGEIYTENPFEIFTFNGATVKLRDDKVIYIEFSPYIVNILFNVIDMDAKQFAEAFKKAYAIPKMQSDDYGSEYYYISPTGVKVKIDTTKTLTIEKIPNPSQRQFD